jgi:3-oxoadipate enol-lactonase/4-carboxymuconolactone decarboxylase
MPFIQIGDIRCYYRLHGSDACPVVVLAHSLGLDHGLWDALTADLLPHCRVLRYDIRGHGATDAPGGDYRIEQLGRDVLALADALGIETFAFCGLSLGGMVGQCLANTTARLTDPGVMEERRRMALEGGMSAVVDVALARSFSRRTLVSDPPAVQWARRTWLTASAEGYAASCAAIRDLNLTSTLDRIRVPTLVIAGDLDQSMPWDDHSRLLAEAIPGAAVVRLPAAHLSNLERPRSFSAAVLEFLLPLPADAARAGERVRRTVLGDAHVDQAYTSTTDFTREFQALLTRYAWGSIWTRPALDPRTRRLVVLSTTAAMGRWEEFRLHVRSGLRGDLEPVDIKEVLLQIAIYAGVPAANTAFQIAAQELAAV